MSSVFRKVLETNAGKKIPANASMKWFQNTAAKVRSVNQRTLFAKAETMNEVLPGHMFMFLYDPKHKETLPYYDTFPLIFPIEMYSDGFLGINLHYLAPGPRAALMDALYDTVTNTKKDKTTRLKISYDILNAASKYKAFKPTIKRYLFNHLRSNFIRVNADDWPIALMLPTQRFKKAGARKVWADSRKYG